MVEVKLYGGTHYLYFCQAGAHIIIRGFPCDKGVAHSDANETFISVSGLFMRANHWFYWQPVTFTLSKIQNTNNDKALTKGCYP